mmetsp:Transcript_16684/g.30346  ORF Transcript_16684/g.30346 Transcript_16684/m.30346 type:complete len:613 (-) Transcript_16684:9-1847(-)
MESPDRATMDEASSSADATEQKVMSGSSPQIDESSSADPWDFDSREQDGTSLLLKHNLTAGDHVIRWEMLPIMWPIQIHGIVLEAMPDYVTIADFGLTSYEKEVVMAAGEEKLTDDEVKKSWNQARSSSSSQPEKEKNRLSILTIKDPKDIKMWKKVNYGENIFSKVKKRPTWWRRGSSARDQDADGIIADGKGSFDGMNEPTTTQETIAEEANADDTEEPQITNPTTEEEDNPSSASSPNGANKDPSTTEVTDSSQDGPKSLEELVEKTNLLDPATSPSSGEEGEAPPLPPGTQPGWWGRLSRNGSVHSPSASTSTASLAKFDSEPPPTAAAETTVDEGNNDANANGTNNNNNNNKHWIRRTAGSFRQTAGSLRQMVQTMQEIDDVNTVEARRKLNERRMNPAMSSILTSNSNVSDSSETNRAPTSPTTPKQPQEKLPKADPPKLVLARTRFLLQHGEAVLPPYNVFDSNSECIAVWCMTGRWSTLQASVFLHSTAIGNAKSTTAMALGAAATQPWLIPALAGVGIVSVAIPWLILKRSNERWDKATMSLTELFWDQAEPEVFVECIENWSQLVKKRNVETNHGSSNNIDNKDDTDEKKDQDSNEPQTMMV